MKNVPDYKYTFHYKDVVEESGDNTFVSVLYVLGKMACVMMLMNGILVLLGGILWGVTLLTPYNIIPQEDQVTVVFGGAFMGLFLVIPIVILYSLRKNIFRFICVFLLFVIMGIAIYQVGYQVYDWTKNQIGPGPPRFEDFK